MKFTFLYTVLAVLLSGCSFDVVEDHRVYVVTPEQYISFEAAYSKPGIGVSLVNRQVNLEGPGVQYAIAVDMKSNYLTGDLALLIEPAEGLYIVDGDTNPTQPLLPQMTFPLTVNAVSDGRYYLYINAVANINGQILSRALTLIVQVGDELKESDSDVLKGGGSSGDVIISMPAKEEIIR